MKCSYLIILFLFIFSDTIFSQESKVIDGIKSFNIKFYVEHPWKKVIGVCNEPKLESFKLIGGKDFPSISSPFIVKCSLLNMKTGDPNRDSHMLEVLGFPENKEIVFSVTSTQIDKDSNYKISGNLNIKDKSNPIVFLAKLSKENTYRINGSFEILLSDYSVERPSLLFVPIKDNVKVEVEILL